MNKIIYKTITIDDNMMLIVQAFIDKQAEIIDWINGLSDVTDNSNLYKDKMQEMKNREWLEEARKKIKKYEDEDRNK